MAVDHVVLSSLVRDGGSAIILVCLNDIEYNIRVMRSFKERVTEDFGRFEVTQDGETRVIDKLEQINGLVDVLKKESSELPNEIRIRFLDPKRSVF